MSRVAFVMAALGLASCSKHKQQEDQPPPAPAPAPAPGPPGKAPLPLGVVDGPVVPYVAPPTPPTEQLDKIGAVKAKAEDLFAIANGAFVVGGPGSGDRRQPAWQLIDEDNTSPYVQLGTEKDLPPIELALSDQVELQQIAVDYVRDSMADHVPRKLHIEASDDGKAWTPILDDELKMPPADDVKYLTKTVVPARFVRISLLGTNALKAKDGVQELQEIRAYGKRITQDPPPSATGTYKIDGVGTVHLKQTGSLVTGCVDGKKTHISGGFDGRVLRFALAEGAVEDSGPVSMTFSKDRAFWGMWPGGIEEHAFMASHDGPRTSDKAGACPGDGKDTIAEDLAATGRTRLYGVVFDSESDVLRDDAKPALDKLVAVMKAQPKLNIRIEANTDSGATPPHNHILTGKQSVAVQQYLVAQGVDAARIHMKAMGATLMIAQNTTPLGRAQNRRIEIVKLDP